MLLNTDFDTGLTSSEHQRRLAQVGPNALEQKKTNICLKFLGGFTGPMPAMIWLAIIIEAVQEDWMDFSVLLVLQILNGTVGFLEDIKAENAVDALKNALSLEAHVKRDGVWITCNGNELVPGDVVQLHSGAAVPADCQLPEGVKPVQVEQAALTGESLPKTMAAGDKPKMGSTIVRGEAEALVVSTGPMTFVGKTAKMIDSVEDAGHFQEVLLSICTFLMAVSFVLVSVCLGYLLWNGDTVLEALAFCVVLLVASIPIAMQVVCTTTMALGSRKLSEQGAIVTRLSAIEQLAGMNMLCSDKTGTLTKNEMELQADVPVFTSTIDGEQVGYNAVLQAAALAAKWKEKPKDALDTLVLTNVDKGPLDSFEQIDYMPFDPSIKRTEATLKRADGTTFKCTKGAPQIVLKLAHNQAEIEERVNEKVLELASRGIRALAVAKTDKQGKWCLLGILTFLDPPRVDTAETISRAHECGVGVKMITGDQIAIAIETCRQINMGQNIMGETDLPTIDADFKGELSANLGRDYGDLIESADGFAQVFPEHKFLIIEILRQRGLVVGMTGDGVNDAPALKKADVGIAVSGATDAARSASDIVLTDPGLSVIIDAIQISRKIFQRMKNYVIYRIACTIQLLVFFFLGCLCIHPESFDTADTHYFAGIEYFKLPVVALVLITILNDGTIISIAYDHVYASPNPESWRLYEVYGVATVLGAVAVASSVMLLYFGLHSHAEDSVFRYWGLMPLNYDEVMMMIYLKISLSDFMTVFAARTQGIFLSRAPGRPLFVAFVVATTTSTVLSLYWPFTEMVAISGHLVAFTWAYCAVWFVIQDLAKLAAYYLIATFRKFELAHKKKVAREAAMFNRKELDNEFYASHGTAAFYSSTGTGAKEPMAAALRRRKGLDRQGSMGTSMTLDQALARIEKIERELTTLKAVVKTASGK
jgi:H+-transporting ATPase